MTSRYLTQTASLHEHTLLSAAQDGDHGAEEELLRRYEPLVHHTVRHLRLPCHADRDDIAQEARLGLLRAIHAWQPARGPFPAFAAQCVRNKTANAVAAARAGKHQPLSQALSLDCSTLASPALEPALTATGRPVWEGDPTPQQPATHADPVAAVLVGEQLAAVRTAWAGLSDMERVVLTGLLNGMSYRQLALELACTVKAVDGALRRARRKLAAEDALVA